MARKKVQEEHVNHERWLVSYADFITLLFAFFVVMYSISSVNEGKYRVLSSTLVTAFSPNSSLKPVQYGKQLQAPIIQHKALIDNPDDIARIGVDHEITPTSRELAQMQKIADEVEFKLKKLVDEDKVNIFKTNKGVEIEIKSSILFVSGQAVIQNSAKSVLKDISAVLAGLDAPINVEGFTDNIPIKTLIFPSNWELSASRAANVVHLFSEYGIKPERMSAIGYGEYKPIVSNNTAEGRERNRRINIVVLNRLVEDRKRIPELEKKKKEKESKIGESIRNAMEINIIGNTLSLEEIETKDSTRQKSEKKNAAPTLLNLGSPSSVSKFDKSSIGGSATKKSEPILLPPPKMLPFGKRTEN